MDFEEKMQELQNDPEFISKFVECETAEAVCELFAQKGIEVTPEELNKAYETLNAPEGELNEDALDDVAGGVAYVSTLRILQQVLIILGPTNNKPRWYAKNLFKK